MSNTTLTYRDLTDADIPNLKAGDLVTADFHIGRPLYVTVLEARQIWVPNGFKPTCQLRVESARGATFSVYCSAGTGFQIVTRK